MDGAAPVAAPAALPPLRSQVEVARPLRAMPPSVATRLSALKETPRDSVGLRAEVDFLARVEAAERRDAVGPAYAQTRPKKMVASTSASAAQQPSHRVVPKPAPKRAHGLQRVNPTREHRIHDETGGARPRLRHKGGSRGSAKGTPRPGGAKGTPGGVKGTPRPPGGVKGTPRPGSAYMRSTPRPAHPR